MISPFSALGRALGNLRQFWLVSLITTAIIAVCLFLVGGYLLLTHNLDRVLDAWRRDLRVTFYLSPGTSDPQVEDLRAALLASAGVERVDYVSREQALGEFSAMVGRGAGFLAGLYDLPLPASLRVTLAPASRNSSGVRSLLARFPSGGPVEEVTWGQEWLGKLESLTQLVALAGGILGGILCLAAVFIISNTIKLTVLSRRDELETMRLVGATEGFIRTPFIIEGLLQGAAGGVFAVALLALLHHAALSQVGLFLPQLLGVGTLEFLPPLPLAELVLGGMVLGALGSLTSVGRFSRT